jgi:glutamyl-tRNA(Gln) amidotransferase subunit E
VGRIKEQNSPKSATEDIDPVELGLVTGLEVHRQIRGRKLFCNCPSYLEEPTGSEPEISRIFHPALSETGGLDDAAASEMMRGSKIRYQVTSNSCLVDLDEEPPYPPSEYAVETALIVSMMLETDLFDELTFMRKIVVDGSNPAGFQRTGMLGIGGNLTVDNTDIVIESVCLEEDSARKVKEVGDTKIFRLDRLGTPEIEITTSPSGASPETIRDAALRIGSLLRSTGRFKRGIGTVRQDVNVSIRGGSRVEVKHVQDPNLIPLLIRKEALRQRLLLDTAELISSRVQGWETNEKDIFDLTGFFRKSEAQNPNANESSKEIFGIRLRGYGGLISPLIDEFIGRIRTIHGTVPDLLTMKELEKRVNGDLLDSLMEKMEIDSKEDELIVIEGDGKTVRSMIEIVVQRVKEASIGVPSEVRRALPDGETEFLRPIAGGLRMYPETDLRGVPITEKMINDARSQIPGSREESIADLSESGGIGMETATQIYEKDLAGTFRGICTDPVSGPVTARILLSILPEIFSREDIETFMSEEILRKVVISVSKGTITREAASKIFRELSESINYRKFAGDKIDEKTIIDILDSLISIHKDLKIDEVRAKEIIRNIANGKRDLIIEKGKGSKGPLMGLVMEELRGKIDGRTVSSLLDDELESILEMMQ